MNNNYYCYNPIKKDFITTKNLMYINTGVNPNTNKTYWIYKRSCILDAILKDWREYQQQRFN